MSGDLNFAAMERHFPFRYMSIVLYPFLWLSSCGLPKVRYLM
jgi:hypothetical protein